MSWNKTCDAVPAVSMRVVGCAGNEMNLDVVM